MFFSFKAMKGAWARCVGTRFWLLTWKDDELYLDMMEEGKFWSTPNLFASAESKEKFILAFKQADTLTVAEVNGDSMTVKLKGLDKVGFRIQLPLSFTL